MSGRIKVKCPVCEEDREIGAGGYKGDLNVKPYVQRCKKCSNKDRTMSPEAREKISASLKGTKQSAETLAKKSKFMKEHPENWEPYLQPELGPEARKGTHHTEETKKKISESVSEAIKSKKEGEE